MTQKHTPDWQLRALKAEALNADLLAALKIADTILAGMGSLYETGNGSKIIRAAIAKAEGK